MSKDYSWRSYKDWIPPEWDGRRQTCLSWLETRKSELKEENLWRVHDSLYDLTDYIRKHPGGTFWLQVTKGTDITEAFESHHLNDGPRKILPKYFVKEASTKRNAPFTFKQNGFYMTLKKRVNEALQRKSITSGPSKKSKYAIDSLCMTTFLLAIITGIVQNYFLAVLTGALVTFTIIAAHNFLHQRNNWRMYLFQIAFLCVRDCRISHAMSHHLYPNTLHDMEITMIEPWLQYLPRPDKSYAAGIFSIFYSPIAYAIFFYAKGFSRLILNPDGITELIPLAIPTSMVLYGVPIIQALFWWNIIVVSASFIFGLIGVNVAHHHPKIFHEGDEPRKDRDWGLFQLDAVKDRTEIKGSFFLGLVLFGDHTLHHLFPTVDHAHLDDLYPVLEEVCTEYGIDYNSTTIWEIIVGQFKQLRRVTTTKSKDRFNHQKDE